MPRSRRPLRDGATAASLGAAGVELTDDDRHGVVAHRARGGLVGVDVTTGPYPGFATDLQASMMALLATAVGTSAVTETILEQRFRRVDELRKMAADIAVHGRTARIRGVALLQAAAVCCTVVRAAATLVPAGLGAAGETAIDDRDH